MRCYMQNTWYRIANIQYIHQFDLIMTMVVNIGIKVGKFFIQGLMYICRASSLLHKYTPPKPPLIHRTHVS